MTAKRIVLLIAPWCFVLFIVIGCSKQGGSSERKSGSGREAITAISSPDDAAEKYNGESVLDRYADLVQSESDPAELRKLLAPFYLKWGRVEGGAAVSHAFAQNRALIVEAFTGWLESDAEAPREWVLAQGASQRKQSGLASGLLHALPGTNHQEKSEWVEHFAAGSFAAPLVSEVAIAWGQSHPQETLNWLDELAAGPARTGAIETVFRRWTEADPELASTHLTRMPDGDAKDLAISSLSKAIHSDDPEAARLWADTISDTGLRDLTKLHLNKLAATSVSLVPGS